MRIILLALSFFPVIQTFWLKVFLLYIESGFNQVLFIGINSFKPKITNDVTHTNTHTAKRWRSVESRKREKDGKVWKKKDKIKIDGKRKNVKKEKHLNKWMNKFPK